MVHPGGEKFTARAPYRRACPGKLGGKAGAWAQAVVFSKGQTMTQRRDGENQKWPKFREGLEFWDMATSLGKPMNLVKNVAPSPAKKKFKYISSTTIWTENIQRFPKIEVPPVIIQVTDDHDVVLMLKTMVTWGPPWLQKAQDQKHNLEERLANPIYTRSFVQFLVVHILEIWMILWVWI